MCLSDDGGENWNCNRCMVAYGVHRVKLDNDPEVQKKAIVADHPIYGDRAERPEQPKVDNIEEKSPEEVEKVEKPRRTRKPRKKEA